MIKREDVLRGMNARGRTMLLKHLANEKLSASQAVIAKCYDCMGYHPDGRLDCKMNTCPLYPWMPYKKDGK